MEIPKKYVYKKKEKFNKIKRKKENLTDFKTFEAFLYFLLIRLD